MSGLALGSVSLGHYLTVGAILNRRPLPTLMRAAGRLRHRWPTLTLHVVREPGDEHGGEPRRNDEN